ncbi:MULTISPECIES: hypothetical protein [Flavobacterium]|uniref:Lipoprotein n=1 Tax=Flavobacterium jumunjinense TaxID=998845 RepID=A0ABV5GU82_9FLAO|nr:MULTISPECIES: hypothetical protein [Flavobacterium]
MNLRTIIYTTLFVTFISCSKYTFTYIPVDEYDNIEKLNKINADNMKYDESFLTFTKSFNDYRIKLYQNDTIKFDSVITTGNRRIYGIAKTFIVNRKSQLKIYFQDINKPLYINEEQMKNYKFIYISKKNKKIEIEFNNGTKKFEQ